MKNKTNQFDTIMAILVSIGSLVYAIILFFGIESSTRRSFATGEPVETTRSKNVNGYDVTVNRYSKDDTKLQVLIFHAELGIAICENVSLNELDKFIADNTK